MAATDGKWNDNICSRRLRAFCQRGKTLLKEPFSLGRHSLITMVDLTEFFFIGDNVIVYHGNCDDRQIVTNIVPVYVRNIVPD